MDAWLDLAITADETKAGRWQLTCDTVSYPLEWRPEADNELQDYCRRLQPVLAGGRDPALNHKLSAAELLYEAGTRLWQVLFPAEVPEAMRTAVADALRLGVEPLRLALPPALATFPWELLCDPDAPAGLGFLAQQRPIMRLAGQGRALPPLTEPLRVLLLISSPPTLAERRQVDVESERAAVEQATQEARQRGLLHLRVEDIVTRQRVHRALIEFRPQIVHYIGHGGYDEGSGVGVLEWEDDDEQAVLFGERELILLLRPFGLRAVVLHGCDTARADTRDDFSGVAGALLRAGLPAVLAQQAKFTYASSQAFSRIFYTQLVTGEGLAEAVFQGRLELALADQPDWAVPTLRATVAGLTPLRAAATPGGSPDPALAQAAIPLDLPAPTGVFVGRQRELRALRRMLESAPGSGPTMALVRGPGGVGKSTLASQAVLRYGGQYRGGLTFRCAGYLGLEVLLQQLAEFLERQGVPNLAEQWKEASTAGKMQIALDILNARGPFLLLFDNLESVQGDERTIRDPELHQFLQALLTNLRGGRVLLTGRYAVERLLPEGRFRSSLLDIDLGDLNAEETRQLLTRHERLGRLDPAIRDELQAVCQGLPYMYDLLSGRAASLDLEQLIHDIQDRLTPERSGPEFARVREEIVRFAALDATLARLAPGARRLLREVSVLRRPWPLEAMTVGLEAAEADWQALLDWSLMRLEADGNYTLHNLTRDYAQERWQDTERQPALLRLAGWYEAYARRSPRLADDLEAHWLYSEAGEWDRAGQLANNLATYFDRFGLFGLWRELCQTTIATATGSTAAEGQRQLGIIAQDQGDYPEARRLYAEARAAFERLGDQGGVAGTLHQLGNLAYQQGDYPEARRLYGEARTAFARRGDQGGVANTLHQLGIIAQDQGDYPEARRLYAESLTIKERLGDQGGVATTLGQLGLLERRLGNQRAALAHLIAALGIFESLRSPYRDLVLRTIGELRAEIGEEEFAALWHEVAAGQALPEPRVAVPQHDLAKRLIAFIQARSWGESRQQVQAQPDLLSDEADQTLAQLAEAQDNPGDKETIELHRTLLARCREIGIAEAFAEFLANQEAAPDVEDDLLQRLITFLQTGDLVASERLLEVQPDLYGLAADALLVRLAAAQQGEGARQQVEAGRELLARCRERGVAAVFAALREAAADADREEEAMAADNHDDPIAVPGHEQDGSTDMNEEVEEEDSDAGKN